MTNVNEALNPVNTCMQIKPKTIPPLPDEDSLKMMFSLQEDFQTRVGKMDEYEHMTLFAKSKEAIYNKFCLDAEFTETIERLSWKNWKRYKLGETNDWVSEEQRVETIFEIIDMWHFFMNICIIFGITADEFVAYYKAKIKENNDRQTRGY